MGINMWFGLGSKYTGLYYTIGMGWAVMGDEYEVWFMSSEISLPFS